MEKALLFPGEEILEGDGVPALTKFMKGNPREALVVFIPGAGHTARIAYGGHTNSRNEDFLAHWLVKQGYNFLGVSYPIHTLNSIYNQTYPDFTVRAWGKQVAEIAKSIIDENNLSNRIIFIVWSNGGRITQSFNETATILGLDVDFCAAFSSTPPVMFITRPHSKAVSHIEMDENGYEDRSRSFASWYNDIIFNASLNQGREIINKDIYLNEYVGNMPINIQGNGLRYKNGAFVPDQGEFLEDGKYYDYGNFPLVATIVTDNAIDGRHALTDRALWGACNANKVYSYLARNKIDLTKLPEERWCELLDLIESLPHFLSARTSGNHFFFVGESGARQSAENLKILEEKVKAFKLKLAETLGLPKKYERRI